MGRSRAQLVGVVLGWVLPLLTASPAPAAPAPQVLYVRSTDGGKSFVDRARLSDGDSGFSHVDAEGGLVHVAWDTGAMPREVLYRRSPDGGASFGRVENVSGNKGDSSESDLVIAGAHVHVVWEDDVLDKRGRPDTCCLADDEVFHRLSPDDGASFGRAVNLSETKRRHSRDPDIAVSGSHIGLIFEDNLSSTNDDIFFRSSTDDGVTWTDAVNLSNDKDQSAEASIALVGKSVHVVFEDRGDDLDPTDDRIAYVRSTDGGRTFSAPVHLPHGAERRGMVAVVGDVVHVAGCSRSDPKASELFYYRSNDGGGTWSKPVNLSDNAGECNKPAIDAAGSHVAVAWQDTTPGENDILFRASSNRGGRFARTVNVSKTSGASEDASVALDPATGHVHLTWTDASPG